MANVNGTPSNAETMSRRIDTPRDQISTNPDPFDNTTKSHADGRGPRPHKSGNSRSVSLLFYLAATRPVSTRAN